MSENKESQEIRADKKENRREVRREKRERTEVVSEWEEKVVSLRRAAKTIPGGKRFRFNATVVVGNRKGKVGLGYGKANELADAIKKAKDKAIANAVPIRLKGSTIPHEIVGQFKASRILMKPATKGTGVIAGGAVRPVLELLGVHDILTKSLRSSNPVNLIKATFDALTRLYNIEDVAAKRGKPVADIFGK
ncbi:small subunit ribosomal protein S5 [Brevinema andersonii]|uniref:Small ribosomal subunit protein uS5 n=1 Tax=Brevinema andersonii TaxID=34097 RepID=A0A1I1CZJ9_BREAD|nr:30S ribosomal protein S5 [Brevinema andersonii]SFB68179.1 small subunit ribosomal protein S5 [Brevinema andersonii]